MITLRRPAGGFARVGHRGASALAPENTLEALELAVELGCDMLEFDVLDLQDGTLVLAHSNDLHEVSHGAARGAVRQRTLESLRRFAERACPARRISVSSFCNSLLIRTSSVSRCSRAAILRWASAPKAMT